MSSQHEGDQRGQSSAGEEAREWLLAGTPVTERRLDLAGVSTAVLEGGEGPPVVLLHGQGGFAAQWLPIIPRLVTTHHVIAPDLPGLGASVVPDGPPDSDLVLRWLGQLLERTCPTPPAVVGHSLGGSIAARFEISHKDRFSRLVLVDAGSLGRFRPAPGAALALIGFIARPNQRTLQRLLRQLSVDPDGVRRRMGERWEPFQSYMVDRARTSSVRAANRRLLRELGIRAIPPEDLARIRVPATLIWGRQDRVMRLRIAEAANTHYGWPLHVIEDAGHICVAEQPEAVLRALHASIIGM